MAQAPAAFERASGTAPPGAPARRGVEYKWIAAGVVVLGALMSILNQTIINVALPTLENDFRVSLTDIQWVVTGYALGLAAVIPLTGWLADRYGTKRVFMTSQILFTLASMLCGLAWSSGSLVGFRVVQGLAGGLIMPVGMTILMTVSTPRERGRMMAALGMPMMVAPILGPLLGGWLVQSVTWRLIFYVNVPVGIAGALVTALFLRNPGAGVPGQRLDVGGLALGVPGVVGIVYGLSQPAVYGWGSVQALLPLVVGAALLVVFCLYELRQRSPLIEIRVFRDAAFAAAMIVNFFIGLALFGSVLLVPYFLQQVQGYGAFDSGVVLAAQGLAAAIAMPIGGSLTDRFGARQVVPFGLAVLTVTTVWMTTLTPDTPRWTMGLMLAGRGVGMGLSMMPAMSSAYISLPPGLISRAASTSNTVQRVASALGVAIVATILTDRILAHLPPLPGGSAFSLADGGDLAAVNLPAAVKAVLLAQAARGFDDAFWVAAAMSLICFPMAVLLRRPPRPETVRRFGLRQLAEGIILGAAARRVARDGLNGSRDGAVHRLDPEAAYVLLAEGARRRLRRGLALLDGGDAAPGSVPLPPLRPALRVLFAVLLVAALAGTLLLVAHGYGAADVPRLALGPGST
ncbi:MAG TPA: DHA2 family efflux MFS transporter permease subunit [Candidatus Dormibacteraeota bacterium]|nr:DHA2 family efflux MFS transporter permease subunit [Candidatus Dormibacteraeota bacterium]